jgi:hypothetical protein
MATPFKKRFLGSSWETSLASASSGLGSVFRLTLKRNVSRVIVSIFSSRKLSNVDSAYSNQAKRNQWSGLTEVQSMAVKLTALLERGENT